MLRVVPDDSDGGEEAGEEGGYGRGGGGLQVLTGTLEEGDELEAVLCTELALLRKGETRESERERDRDRERVYE